MWRVCGECGECSECGIQVVSRGMFSKTMPPEYNDIDMENLSMLDGTEPFVYARSRSHPYNVVKS